MAAAIVIFSDRSATSGDAAAGAAAGRARAARGGTASLEARPDYRHHHGALAGVLASSVAVQVLRVLQAWCLGRALRIDAPMALYFVAIPVVR